MLLQLLKAQKEESEILLSLQMVAREGIGQHLKTLDSKLIKVIVGPRRAGKSTAALQLLRGRKFAYLNFDDESLLKLLISEGTHTLIESLEQIYGKFDFLLIDEVQNLDGWELLVNRLQRNQINLVITGSNSKLLSNELASHLTGRYIEICILPFSWNEYKLAKPNLGIVEYMRTGGFPEVVMTGIDYHDYLDTLAQSILFKDIVRRYSIRFPSKLYDLFTCIQSNVTKEYSLGKLKKLLGFASKTTLQNYLVYLENTFLFVGLRRFSFKNKEVVQANPKAYLVDNGIINEELHSFDPTSKYLENMVLVDLIRRGYSPERQIFYYRTKNGREIDFVLKKGIKIEALIQVAYVLSDPDTLKREQQALIEAQQELNCENLIVISFGGGESLEMLDKNKKAMGIIDFYRREHKQLFSSSILDN